MNSHSRPLDSSCSRDYILLRNYPLLPGFRVAVPIPSVISSSRGILYASREAKDFDAAARKAAEDLRDRINRTLAEEGIEW